MNLNFMESPIALIYGIAEIVQRTAEHGGRDESKSTPQTTSKPEPA